MNRLLPLADRLVEPSLRLLAAINVLFLASFCLVLLLATGKARAEDAASCGGKDLLSEITPAEAETIKAAADATLNGKGTLWKIEKAGLEPSWLFGTMHMTDPRVSTLSAKAQSAYESTRTIVIETTDVLDERKMMSELGKEPELMMFTDGSTLTSKLSAEDAKALEAACRSGASRSPPWRR